MFTRSLILATAIAAVVGCEEEVEPDDLEGVEYASFERGQYAAYAFTTIANDVISASGGAYCLPAVDTDDGWIVTELVLDAAKYDNIVAVLGSGGTAGVELWMRNQFQMIGLGTAEHDGTVRLEVNGVVVASVDDAHSGPPSGIITSAISFPFDASFPTDVQPGDTLHVVASGSGTARTNGCSGFDQSLVIWRHPNGGTPYLVVRP